MRRAAEHQATVGGIDRRQVQRGGATDGDRSRAVVGRLQGTGEVDGARSAAIVAGQCDRATRGCAVGRRDEVAAARGADGARRALVDAPASQ